MQQNSLHAPSFWWAYPELMLQIMFIMKMMIYGVDDADVNDHDADDYL